MDSKGEEENYVRLDCVHIVFGLNIAARCVTSTRRWNLKVM